MNENVIRKEYRYEISILYKYKGEEAILEGHNISSLIIQSNYEKYNIPIIMINLKVDTKVKNSLINNYNNKEDNTVVLKISKFIYSAKEDGSENVEENNLAIREDIIHKSFNFIIDPTSNKVSQSSESLESQDSDPLEELSIGLIDMDKFILNKNKINTVVKNSTLKSLILHYLSKYKILIEPFNDYKIDQFVIPPQGSITELLNYISKYYNIYDSGHILFHDVDKSYLLSRSGKGVKYSKDEYHFIDIELNDNSKLDQYVNTNTYGMYYDEKSIILNVSNNADFKIMESNEVKTGGTIGIVGSNGETKEIILNEENKNNYKLYKISSSNIDILDIYKYNIKLNNKAIHISKSGIDSSEITPNKEYNLIHVATGDKYKLLLTEKIDSYVYGINNFIINSSLIFRVIPS